jgi:hypothetical protein
MHGPMPPTFTKTFVLQSTEEKVDGIGKGLEIQGKGTFKFSIENNKGRVDIINIPNNLY